MLELVDIHKEFDGKKVLDGISLSVAAGECVCLTGASGCGKTTLLRIAAGLETADSGVRNINAKTKIAVLFQEDRLLPWDTALSNITAVGVDADRARYFLKRVGLENEADSYPDELSGGMKRRLSLARMLAYGGDLYLFDEAHYIHFFGQVTYRTQADTLSYIIQRINIIRHLLIGVHSTGCVHYEIA